MTGTHRTQQPADAGSADRPLSAAGARPAGRRAGTGRTRALGPSDRERRDRDRGSATVWTLLLAPALFLGVGLVVDGGRAVTARQDALGLASEAARAAVDRMDVTGYRGGGGLTAVAPGSARAAACTWVDDHRPDASCGATVGAEGRVDVTVRITYRPALLSAVGVGPQLVSATAGARPAVGDTVEVDVP